MIIPRPAAPAPNPRLAPAALPRGERARRDQAWRLLAPGDRVSIVGRGAYRIVHISEARAWISGLDDGANRLVAAPLLRLLGGGGEGATGHA